MALVYKDRVKEFTATIGTGEYVMGGALPGYQPFAAIGDNTCYYAVTNGRDWEVGLGTYTLLTQTLARTSVVASTNVNQAVDWGFGNKVIWNDVPGEVFGEIFAAITPAALLDAIKTVDGAGSGLDADMLDGLDSTDFQPVDSDLTAIAALTTTAYGRALLTLADQAALQSAVGLSGYQPLDSDLTAIAALTTTTFGRSFLALADAAAARTLTGLVIGTNVQAFDAATMKANATAAISIGFTLAPNNLGNIASFTVNPALGNYQYGTNHAAATWTAPTSDCAVTILVTNDATAGAITFSGFTVSASVGDALTTTNASKFVISILRINGVSTYLVKALQ